MKSQTVFFTILCTQLLAHPNGAEVVSGVVQMQAQGNVLEIQAPDRSIIHWNDFSIQKGEVTRFLQPDATASVLNRVIGLKRSMINGVMEANGRVILINPNGVIVGKEAVIHVAEFIGATQDVLDLSDWSVHLDPEGAVHFQEGAVVNHEGIIQATGVESRGGRVLLVADSVNVKGTIEAPQGRVELYGNDLVLEEMALIDVSGELGGGTVLIGDASPGSVTRIGSAVQIHADAKTAGDGGRVLLWSGEATQFYGSATAQGGALSGDGGLIELSSLKSLGCTGIIDASAPNGASGEILFDPCDITIGAVAAGPAFTFPIYTPGANATITGASIAAALGGGSNVTLNTSPGAGGTGIVQWDSTEPIFWFTGNRLTINADSNVTLNANIVNVLGQIDINSFGGNVDIFPIGAGATANVQSFAGGLVRITARGNITLTTNAPGQGVGVGGGMQTDLIAGGNIILNGVAGSPVAVTTSSGAPSPIFLDAGGSVILGPNSEVSSEFGPITVIADRNIEMRAGSSIYYFFTGAAGPPPAPIILVVDDQAPTAPQIGDGAFLMDAGAFIGNTIIPRLSSVQIFTARRSQNSINGPINGVFFMPGPYGIDTDTERWRVYYPNGFFNPNNPFFTIFYKEPQPLPTILAQTLGQAFIVIEEFAYPPAFYEDHFCVTECANAMDKNKKERRECPWVQIDNYRKFYPNRQKYAYLTSDDSLNLQPNCEEPIQHGKDHY